MFTALTPFVMTHPQLHSHDYYIRLPFSVLTQFSLDHLFTAPDDAVMSDAAREGFRSHKAGYTEWSGSVAGQVVSFAWDWVQLADGDIRLFKRVAPRSNVRLVDEAGYDLTDAQALEMIWRFIELLPWRTEVAEALRLDSQFGSLTPGCSRFN